MTLGFGFLYTLIALGAQWWALALVTRLRPERLVDPASGGPANLTAWLALSGLFAYGATALIL